MNYLRLIRWPNLLIIILIQYLIRFFIIEIESLQVPHFLDHIYFAMGAVCSISLAAAGYIVNDIFDVPNDVKNKPKRVIIGKHISENIAWSVYATFNIIAFIIGYILAEHIGISGLWLLPVVAAALLYLYAIDLKKRPLLGNFIVSLLTALPVFLVAVYDILPAVTSENADVAKPVFYVIIAYSVFAFYTNFIREVIKDAEDIEGDAAEGFKTLAVLFGKDYIRYLIIILILVLVVFTGYFNIYLFPSDKYSAIYILIFINLPLLYLIFKIATAKQKSDFRKASTLMKIIMLTGILSMVVFTLAINQMAADVPVTL